MDDRNNRGKNIAGDCFHEVVGSCRKTELKESGELGALRPGSTLLFPSHPAWGHLPAQPKGTVCSLSSGYLSTLCPAPRPFRSPAFLLEILRGEARPWMIQGLP